MKKFSRSIVILLVLLMMLSVAAFAETKNSSSLPYYVSDSAGVLTSEEWQELENKAERISREYQCGVYIVTLDDYRDFGSYSSFWSFSEEFYTRYQMGIGEQRNGILLIMSMEDRDYSLLAYGSNAHYSFTDYGKEVLENSFLDNFRRNDWYGGFADYLNGAEMMLKQAAAGNPLDVSYESREGINNGIATAMVIGIPCLVAFGACEGMKRQMKPVSRQSRADEYVVPGGINLSVKRDVFLNRTVTRTRIQTEHRENSSSGGGTTVNSSGFSGHSGKF